MYSLIRLKTLASCALLSLAFLPQIQAAPAALHPPPDGCYPGFTTAEGCQALQDLTTGTANTALGWRALFSAGTAGFNVGVGAGALVLDHGGANGSGDANTAVGTAALLLNGSGPVGAGTRNTAVGAAAMVFNTGDASGMGSFNCALGAFALNNNDLGFSNEAVGDSALFSNIAGAANTAIGDLALESNDATGDGLANFNCAVGSQALNANVSGDSNNAVGASALVANTDGLFNEAFGAFALSSSVHGASNVAVGDSALLNYTGASDSGFNTVVGDLAGGDLTDGSDNIYIGAGAGTGVTTESQTIRIGEEGFISECYIQGISGVIVTGDPVVVDADGQLGVAAAGSPLSMKEMLKQRQVVQQLKATTEKQAARIALQEDQISSLTAALKQQAEQIQKVSAQLEMVRPAPRVVNNQ